MTCASRSCSLPRARGQPKQPQQQVLLRSAAAEAAPAAALRTPARTPASYQEVVVICDVPYTKLEVCGRGGTSQVFRVLGPTGQIYALKQVSYKSDPSLLEAVQNEYLRLAAALYVGTDPIDAHAMPDREIFDLLGFD